MGVFALEAFNTAFTIHEFLLAGIERMAVRADFHVNLVHGGAGLEGVATGAFHGRFDIVRMDAFFHDHSPEMPRLGAAKG